MYTIDDIIQYIHNVDKELSVEQTSKSKIRLYGHTGRNHKSSKQRFKFELDVDMNNFQRDLFNYVKRLVRHIFFTTYKRQNLFQM